MSVRRARSILPLASLLLSVVPPARAEAPAPHGAGPRIVQADGVKIVSPDAVVPLQLDGSLAIVPVTIGGKGPFRFILDTGAAGSVVSQSLADELELHVMGDAQLGSPTSDKKIPAKEVRMETAEVGGVRITGLRAVTMDMGKLFPGNDPPRGVLSIAVFQGLLLTIDYPGKQITIRNGELPAPDSREVFEYDPAGHLPSVPIEVAGEKLTAHLDSGSPAGISLPKSYASKLPLASEPVEVGRMRTVESESVVLGSSLKGNARVGRYVVENPDLRFSDLSVGNIGFDILQHFAITLDPKQHRLKLASGSEVIKVEHAPRPTRRYGLRMRTSSDGQIDVEGTDPGSPAEKAGLRQGDHILSINGTPVADLDGVRLAMMMRASPVKMTIERDGKKSEIEMTLD